MSGQQAKGGKKLRRVGKGRSGQNDRTFRNIQRRRKKHAKLYPNDIKSLSEAKRFISV